MVGGRVVALVVAGRVVVGRLVVTGGRAVVRARVVGTGALPVVAVVEVVVATVVSGAWVVLSSSAVEVSTVVVSSMVVVSVVVGCGADGGWNSLAKRNVSRIAARNSAMKIAVRLSFLFFRWRSPSFLIVSQPTGTIQRKRKCIKKYSACERLDARYCEACFSVQPEISVACALRLW